MMYILGKMVVWRASEGASTRKMVGSGSAKCEAGSDTGVRLVLVVV